MNPDIFTDIAALFREIEDTIYTNTLDPDSKHEMTDSDILHAVMDLARQGSILVKHRSAHSSVSESIQTNSVGIETRSRAAPAVSVRVHHADLETARRLAMECYDATVAVYRDLS